MNLQNSHDSYFKSVFSKKENLIPFLEKVLPQEVFSCLDINTITIEPNSYIDKKLIELYSDLTISCLLNNCKSKIYILVEHKSFYDNFTLLQMLKYMIEIWIKDSKDKNNKYLYPIIPMLFYQNKGKEPCSQFNQLFDNNYPDFLKQYKIDFTCEFFNLNKTPDEQLDSTFDVELALFFLKYSRNNIELIIETIIRLTKNIFPIEPEKQKSLRTALLYSFKSSGMQESKFSDILNTIQINPKLKEEVMTLADSLIQKGEQIGIQKGKLEGKIEGEQIGIQKGKLEGKLEQKIEMAKKLKIKKMSITEISEITGLTEETIKSL